MVKAVFPACRNVTFLRKSALLRSENVRLQKWRFHAFPPTLTPTKMGSTCKTKITFFADRMLLTQHKRKRAVLMYYCSEHLAAPASSNLTTNVGRFAYFTHARSKSTKYATGIFVYLLLHNFAPILLLVLVYIFQTATGQLLTGKLMLGRSLFLVKKDFFGPRTAKSQPIWRTFCTHLLLYGIHLWADLDRHRHVGGSRPNQNDCFLNTCKAP